MTAVDRATLDDLQHRISRGQRSAIIRTAILSFGTVAVAALFLWFTLRELSDAKTQLAGVEQQVAQVQAAQKTAEQARDTAEKDRDAAVAARTEAEQALSDASRKLVDTQGRVAVLEQQVATLQDELKEALNFEQHIYQLDWADMKSMYIMGDRPARLLQAIAEHRNDLHWGMANTPEGGYNSPGFAQLIMQQLGFLPAGTSIVNLTHDDGGKPHLGDIVIYESGYHMFYFRDMHQKEYVAGMTPAGIVSLEYNFGIKRTGLLRTGLSDN